jgi:hypothetical protein
LGIGNSFPIVGVLPGVYDCVSALLTHFNVDIP